VPAKGKETTRAEFISGAVMIEFRVNRSSSLDPALAVGSDARCHRGGAVALWTADAA
jgi:hypothetical protein